VNLSSRGLWGVHALLLSIHVLLGTLTETLHCTAGRGGAVQKIMAGLLSQWQWAGDKRALAMARAMGSYFQRRVHTLVGGKSRQWHVDSLNMEYGGMNDVFYSLYRATNETEYLGHSHTSPLGSPAPQHKNLP
jgi:hypothetical protein